MSDADATPPSEPDVPSRFSVSFEGKTLRGVYRVEKKLAEGGMGAVYLAEDTNLGRKVVVKVPHVRFLGEPGFRSRFRREIAELVRLEHPRIVRILAQGEEDEVPYFVLQYLGGGSLEDRLKKGKQTVGQALAWLVPIAETLDFVHGRGVIHRDVKPGNILFDEGGHVFLSDFGVVKALERDDGANLTDVGTGVGSPFYAAPEQALGKDLAPSSDQYALASTLYEAISGKPPFGRGSLAQMILAKDREPPPSLCDALPEVPAAADAAIRQALSREPSERFATCAQFADACRKGAVPVESAGMASPSRGWRVAALVAIALVVLAGVGAATSWFGLAPPSPPAAADGASELTAVRAMIHVVKVGAPPLRVLRRHLVVDARERGYARFDQSATRSMDGSAGDPERSSFEQDVDVHVVALDPRRAQLEWKFSAPRVPADAGNGLEGREIASIGELVGTSVLGPRGVMSDVVIRRVRTDAPLPPAVSAQLSHLEDSLLLLSPVFPAEPVGVGAEWDVTHPVQPLGIRIQRTVSYTLLESEGPRLRLSTREAYAAPSQAFEMGPGLKGPRRVDAVVGSGEGEIVVDLGHVLPVSAEAKGAMTVEVSWPVGEKSQGMKIVTKFATRSHAP